MKSAPLELIVSIVLSALNCSTEQKPGESRPNNKHSPIFRLVLVQPRLRRLPHRQTKIDLAGAWSVESSRSSLGYQNPVPFA